jgi:hypothetical protein
LYEKLGFSTQSLTHVWRAPSTTVTHAPAENSLLSDTTIEELVVLDEGCFGAPRHNLLRRWVSRFADRCFTTLGAHGEQTGYITAGEARIGPWVAPDDSDAEVLLDRALALPFSEPPAVFIPEYDRVATALVEARGFERVRTLKRMGRGLTRRGKPGLRALATAGFG